MNAPRTHRGGNLVEIAQERAERLREMARQSEAITWKTEAVLRENASLILTLSQALEHRLLVDRAICGMVSNSGPNLEPLACGFMRGHDGEHAWATLPTWTAGRA